MRKKKKSGMVATLFKAVVVRTVLGKGGMKKLRHSYQWSENNAHAAHNAQRQRTAKICPFSGEKVYIMGRWEGNAIGGGAGPRQQHQNRFIKNYIK